MKKILVTGASGFVGQPVLKYLHERDFEIHAAQRKSAPLPGYVTQHPADLLAPGEPKRLIAAVRPTHLLHLAWDVSPGLFWRAQNNLDWVAATLSLYKAFARNGGERAVLAGTCAEYDWNTNWLDEATTVRKPQTLYGVAKNAVFDIIMAASGADIRVAWARLFFLYGPGESAARLVPDVMDSLRRGARVPCTLGTQERDFMHVDDVARALAIVTASDHRGAVNIASGDCRPVRGVIEKIGTLAGRPELLDFGAKPFPENEPARMAANVSLLRELGFTPRYSLDEGLKQTWEWRKALAQA